MRILVIGSGGREHALVWKLKQSPRVSEVFVAPGNGGTAREGAINVAVDAGDLDGLVELARKEKIDLVVPGPELPLTKGITDRMREAGIPCFGPDAYCACLEGSKAFAKDVMNRAGVPTAHSQVFTDPDKAKNAVVKLGAPLVVKADGLAAGKGVVVAKTTQEALDAVDDIMCKRAHGAAGAKLVIEEFLVGEEASFLCLCDGKTAVPLPSAQDHKAAYDGDQGPNTGGMGAYSPAPILPYNEAEAMADTVIRPILAALAKDGHPFVGVLYAGLMMTENGPKVLEYNTRFGDPECQPLLMRLEGDLVQIMLDCIEGKLRPESLSHTSQTALGVVVAAEGYPHAYPKGMVIEGLDEADALPGVKVFHSGTSMDGDKILSSGGRVLCVTALGDTLADAQARAYEGVKAIRMDKSFHRSDIGQKGIRRLEQLAQEEK
ncbi:phosphoribosylamine--glycine ligase [Desulfovibrio sp.]|uniref:phosphoribosylamine--glycine ligase n=1 Tax=Desulfovibrio sp. TaxID=885 RepID=UPI00257C5718|nr:phosphoribosylamine--glycine ligase [Desulfovibrio sp.]MBR2609705.1 phosphoribosylamine--glycine ligase [Desulfovibrio sp.]